MASILMDMFLMLFHSLRRQLSAQNASQVLAELMATLDGDHIEALLEKDNNESAEFITRLIQLLKIILEDNSRSFNSLTPDIVSFCLFRGGPAILKADVSNIGRSIHIDETHRRRPQKRLLLLHFTRFATVYCYIIGDIFFHHRLSWQNSTLQAHLLPMQKSGNSLAFYVFFVKRSDKPTWISFVAISPSLTI
jgi:hypothetical protein